MKTDQLAGLIFIIPGIAGLIFGRDLRIGDLSSAGPGFAPIFLSIALIVVGAVIGFRAWFVEERGRVRLHLGPVFTISSGIFVFALLIQRAGILITLFAMVLTMSLLSHDRRLFEGLLTSVATSVVITGLFVYGLGLNLRLWWW